ncbi:hypothetical protein Btru_014430 [Bulinus truncatus]|nr:hypothetical protein Btru_014430 [Bulinus truncatus]
MGTVAITKSISPETSLTQMYPMAPQDSTRGDTGKRPVPQIEESIHRKQHTVFTFGNIGGCDKNVQRVTRRNKKKFQTDRRHIVESSDDDIHTGAREQPSKLSKLKSDVKI